MIQTHFLFYNILVYFKFVSSCIINISNFFFNLNATEYGVGNTVSTNGDIFSYGILVLETITGKRPSDGGFRQGSSIRDYVKLGLHNQVMDIVDIRLFSDLKNGLRTISDSSYQSKIDCLASLLRLGMSCSEETPSSRMPTGDIIRELRATKELVSVLGNAEHEDAGTELS
jgi:serine/threonine protein kinase